MNTAEIMAAAASWAAERKATARRQPKEGTSCPCCGSRVETGVHPALDRVMATPLPLGRIASRCLAELIASFGQWIPTWRLVHAVYWDRSDGGPEWPEQTIRVQLRNERDKIAKLGLRIEGHRNSGRYRVVWEVQSPELSPFSTVAA